MPPRQRQKRSRAAEVGRDLNEPLAFGPSNVAIWSVALPVEMLDGSAAVERARQVNPVLSRLASTSCVSRSHGYSHRLPVRQRLRRGVILGERDGLVLREARERRRRH